MAKKLDSEQAFDLLDHGEDARLLGDTSEDATHHAIATEAKPVLTDFEEVNDKSTAQWIRYTITVIAILLGLGFATLLISGTYLIFTSAPTEEVKEEPLKMFSESEIKELITTKLKAYLDCSSTGERLGYVLSPNDEKEAMVDYYDRRGNLDSKLWKVQLIKSANLESGRIWMVAYLDVHKGQHFARFEREGNDFLLQWSSTYGYGQISWDNFAREQPAGPVQMRCHILRYTGMLPPGIDPEQYLCFVVENEGGEFTSLAIMRRRAEGAYLLERLPMQTRNPVNLELGYIDLPNGLRQLAIHELIHFQWHQHSKLDKGRPIVPAK